MSDDLRFKQDQAENWKAEVEALNQRTETTLNEITEALNALKIAMGEDDAIMTVVSELTDLATAKFESLVESFTELVQAVQEFINSLLNMIAKAVAFWDEGHSLVGN